jgi:hypothetical protein
MPNRGWKRLFLQTERLTGEGNYPIEAYSEFMPPPRLGLSSYMRRNTGFFNEKDPWGWPVTEYEEAFQLVPGLQSVAQQILGALVRLARGEPTHGISRSNLSGNRYWPQELAQHARSLAHERFVAILPLALSRTQDDKGRVRWTLFGGSEQGPARAFWRGFYTAPRREVPEECGIGFFQKLLNEAYGERIEVPGALHRAGFRILFRNEAHVDEPRPPWTFPYLWAAGQPLDGVKYLWTFLPFGELPDAAVSRQLAILGSAGLRASGAGTSPRSPDPVASLRRAPRGPARTARSPVGLDARA